MSANKAKPTTPKRVSLSMLKGRPGSLSVPSFSFRFNPTDEEGLEEVCELGEDFTEEKETTGRPTPSPPPSPATTTKNGTVKSKKNKRTLSLDGSDSPELTTAAADTWSILSEIRGKIVRTVEEAKNRIDQHVRRDPDKEKNLERNGSTEIAEDALERSEEDTAPPKDAGCEVSEDVNVTVTSGELRHRKNMAGSQQPSIQFTNLQTSSRSVDTIDMDIVPNKTIASDGIETTPSASLCQLADQHLPERNWTIVSKKMYVLAIFLLLVYVLLPLPDYLNGLITGVVFALGLVRLWRFLTRPPDRSYVASNMSSKSAPQPSNDRPAAVVHKAWMNELLSYYSPEDFHIGKTVSSLARLDATTLRVSYPNTKIPKRAMWNEPSYKPTFIYQRLYNLEGAKIALLPRGLARKRHWSRRYPMLIFLAESGAPREVGTPAHLVKENDKRVVLLFARSGREKEEWFRKLEIAAGCGPAKAENDRSLEFAVYMARLMASPVQEMAPSIATEVPPSPTLKREASGEGSPGGCVTPKVKENVAWLNAILGRGFWDFVHGSEWSSMVGVKIQKKLSKIRVPSFIEDLRLSDIELGQQLPQVQRVSPPVLDDRGLWLDVDISYYGAFQMTLETKLNLMKLKRDAVADCSSEPSRTDSPIHTSSFYDDEAEESVESSSDEEATSDSGEASDEVVGGGGTTGRKILKLMDSITQSRYFQHATEYKYVKKAMEGVSNMPLMLTVELVSLTGTLVLNVPPPPSDRLWYGFRGNPNLSLVAKPKVGERQVAFAQIVEWIEKKLVLEFQRILVLPNLDDLVLPFANPGTNAGSTSPQKGSLPTPMTSCSKS